MTRDEWPDELSPAERRALSNLPREMDPPAGLEERVVALLRRRGHLPIPLRRRGQLRPWLVGAAAAALAIFASGVALGQYIGSRHVLDAVGKAASASEVAAHVQRAGSLYVAALSSLSQVPDSANAAARDSVRAVAMRILGEAAQEMALIAPDDPLAAAVLRGLSARSRQQEPVPASRTVVWY